MLKQTGVCVDCDGVETFVGMLWQDERCSRCHVLDVQETEHGPAVTLPRLAVLLAISFGIVGFAKILQFLFV